MRRVAKIIGIVAAGIILIVVVIAIATSGNETPAPVTAPAEPAPSAETEEPAPIPIPTFEPIVITGSGDKTSPPFTVTTFEWIIDWSYTSDDPEYAVFGFFVYPRGETALYIESVLFPEATSGSTYSYAGPGDYYIKVTAGNIKSWEVVIKPA